jgi:dihydroxyacetone kinase
VPAVAAYEAAALEGGSFGDALAQMAIAAEKGKESTRDLVAKIGRASRLGERSRGVLDAGATSGAMILQTIASVLEKPA